MRQGKISHDRERDSNREHRRRIDPDGYFLDLLVNVPTNNFKIDGPRLHRHGDRDSTHSADVDYAKLLPRLLQLNVTNYESGGILGHGSKPESELGHTPTWPSFRGKGLERGAPRLDKHHVKRPAR